MKKCEVALFKVEMHKIKKIFNWLLIIGLGLGTSSCADQMPEPFSAKVMGVKGETLTLDNGQDVSLVGVIIPDAGDINFNLLMNKSIKSLLLDKVVRVEILVTKGIHDQYSDIDLARVYLESVNVNEKLLREGGAFFREDYWDKGEKERYRQLSQTARENELGIWADVEKLEILYVRHKLWRFIHDPTCEKVAHLSVNDRVEYFTPLPFVRRGIQRDWNCGHCANIWEGRDY